MNLPFNVDHPAFIIFYLITLIWIAEFAFFPSRYREQDRAERRSFMRIMSAILISHTLSISTSLTGIFPYPPQDTWIMYVALVTYFAGLLLRYISIIHLGHHFTRDVEVSSQQHLVSTGPYRILRHPLYLGLWLLTVSVPFFLNNWVMVALSSVLMFIMLNQRMTLEEQLMEEVIGESYRRWKKSRYRFIPWIY